MNLRHSLVGRLVGLAAVWAVVLLVAGGVALSSLYRNTVFRDVDDGLDGTVRLLLETIALDDAGRIALPALTLDPRYSQTYSGRYWQVFRVDEETLAITPLQGSRSLGDEALRIDESVIQRAEARPGQRVAGDGEGPESQRLRVLATIVRLENAGGRVMLAAALDRGPADRDVRSFALAASWTLALFAVGLVAAVYVQVRWGLAPLFAMRKEVADIREGRRQRLEEGAPAELAPLARELNALIDHNREVVERARAHVGNLAHALKTSISILLNDARGETGEFAEQVARQTDKMHVQVEHHLKQARAAARAQTIGARTSVKAVVDDLARALPRMYADRNIRLETDVADDLIFRGERQDLEEMIGNLLENAFKWTQGRVLVQAAAREPNRIEVCVDDDGEGLPAHRRKEVIARGARLDEAAPGSGLGLAIVHDLARAYSGELVLDESPMGGLRAALRLPSAPGRVTPR